MIGALPAVLCRIRGFRPEDKNYDTQFPVTTNGVDYMVFVRIRAF